MKRFLLVCIMVALTAPALELRAGPKQGVMEEFRAVEEAIRARMSRTSPEAMKRTLEDNIVRAVKMAIERRYYREKDQYLKDLNIENISYENPTSPTTYFVKYKNFIMRVDYVRDPQLFILRPNYEKFLLIEEGPEHEKPGT